jgi:hypothetical protein
MNSTKIIKLDYGNCKTARFCGKEAYVKDMSPRTETIYKAGNADELAQHSEVFCSALKVKIGVVYRNNMLLPGEALLSCNAGLNLPYKRSGAYSNVCIQEQGVSRGHSSPVERTGSSRRRVTRPMKSPEVSGRMKDRT